MPICMLANLMPVSVALVCPIKWLSSFSNYVYVEGAKYNSMHSCVKE